MQYEIDLISDNASQPTDAMRQAMARAPVGDEEFGEDPTVSELEELAAGLTGKEAALFMPSGTMCNIVSYFVHCGDEGEVLIDEASHPVYSGYGGPAVRGRPLLRCVPGERGVISPEQIAAAGGLHDRLRVVSLENTHNRSGGSVWPRAALTAACSAAHGLGLVTHLDGARLPNACAASGLSWAEACAQFDSAWIDLSKGLGCPTGAVLVGSAAFIDDARTAKYLFGGLTHKAGMAAAAGLYAFRHHVDRLQDDHEHAAELARGLAELPGIQIAQATVETNIVYFELVGFPLSADELLRELAPAGLRFKALGPTLLRAVTHLGIHAEHVPRVVDAVRRLSAAG